MISYVKEKVHVAGSQEQWKIITRERPTAEEIREVIRYEKPPEGYGGSTWHKPKKEGQVWETVVSSYASCD